MGHVFISYKTEDRDTAQRMRQALRAEFKEDAVWWDQNLQNGGYWSQEIDTKLSSAACVVVLWSKRSVQSQWVQQEAAVAKALGILAPAQIEDCEIPTPYASIQAARLINWQGNEKDPEFVNLASRVKACLKNHPSNQKFRTRIKNNLTKWTLGSLLIGFLAGFGAYQIFSNKTAQLEPVPSPTIRLEAEIKSLKEKNATLESQLAKYTSPPPLPPNTADPNERVLFYKAQILSLRGDIEGRSSNILDTVIRQRSLQLADLIGKINKDQLKPAIKIIQHEYGGWAFLMGVSTFPKAPPEDIAAASRIDNATKAVAEFDLALNLMADITRAYRANEPAAIPIYEWMTGPSEDVNRTHHLKAIALAVKARAGGEATPQEAIAEFSAIRSSTYLATFPAKDNPDLAWAQQTVVDDLQ